MVYTIGIGSNERREENMTLARRRLSGLFAGIRFSEEEETKPLSLRRQAMFSNQVARFDSHLSPDEILPLLKTIEREAGRTAEEKRQEVVRLDIDLLACDDIVYKPEDWKREDIVRGLEQLSLFDIPKE